MNEGDQRSSALIEKRLEVLRRSTEYADLMRLAATALASTDDPDVLLAQLADEVVRPILADLSACTRGQASIAILHMGVIPTPT